MTRITFCIKTPQGEIQVSGETTEEVLNALRTLDQDFLADANEMVSTLLEKQVTDDLKGIVDIGRDGPMIVTTKEMSHYELIGLMLFCSKDRQASAREIKTLLAASGKRVTVPARLHEMKSRGTIFKPDERGVIYKLSTRGVKWVEDEVLPQLKKK